MEVGEVRVAEDNDFEVLKIYLNRNDGWQLEYKRGQTLVWTRHVPDTSDFKMIRVFSKESIIIAICFDVFLSINNSLLRERLNCKFRFN